MKYAGLALIPAALIFSACSDEGSERAPRTPTGPGIKLSVLRDGTLLVDGQPTAPETVRDRLFDVVRQDGYVLYYREGGAAQPPEAAMATMSAVMDAIKLTRLPVRLSSKADFSDYIDEKGQSRTP